MNEKHCEIALKIGNVLVFLKYNFIRSYLQSGQKSDFLFGMNKFNLDSVVFRLQINRYIDVVTEGLFSVFTRILSTFLCL